MTGVSTQLAARKPPQILVVGSDPRMVQSARDRFTAATLRTVDPSFLGSSENTRLAPLVYWANQSGVRPSEATCDALTFAIMQRRPIVTQNPLQNIPETIAPNIAGNASVEQLIDGLRSSWERQWIGLFDADDTLFEDQVQVQRWVREVGTNLELSAREMKERAHQIMGRRPIGRSKADMFQDFFDWLEHQHTLQPLGLGVASLMSALGMAAGMMAPGNVDVVRPALIGIRGLIDAMHRNSPPLMPHAESSLATLAEAQLRLHVVSRGEHIDQYGKVERAGLVSHFASVIAVRNKSAEVYTRLFAEHDFDPRYVVKVGNSVRSDVMSALGADAAFAVHIPPKVSWAYEVQAVPSEIRTLRTVVHLSDGTFFWRPRFHQFTTLGALITRSNLSKVLLEGRPLALD